MVPMMDVAVKETLKADIFLVVGTSLQVYPAAGLLQYVKTGLPVFIVDPNLPEVYTRKNMTFIKEKAGSGMKLVKEKLLKDFID